MVLSQRQRAQVLEAADKTAFFIVLETGMAGGAVADRTQPEVRAALDELRQLNMRRLLLLIGRNERSTAAVAGEMGLEYRVHLPEDKIVGCTHCKLTAWW